MNKIIKNFWSESLQQQTRDAVENLFVGIDAKLHFKHHQKGSAYISLEDLVQSKFLLVSKKSKDVFLFNNIDALIKDGWAID